MVIGGCLSEVVNLPFKFVRLSVFLQVQHYASDQLMNILYECVIFQPLTVAGGDIIHIHD